jgi:hypothetical protein
MEAILITTENKKRKIKVNTFDEARQLVCNYNSNSIMQVITLIDGNVLLFDEEGKLKNFAFNEIATELAHTGRGIYPSDFIVGDVLMVDADEFNDLPYE